MYAQVAKLANHGSACRHQVGLCPLSLAHFLVIIGLHVFTVSSVPLVLDAQITVTCFQSRRLKEASCVAYVFLS